ncbi:MAG: SdpI family protein [Clostridia bacterium]|nr:SdpI family protein [Clostridia bacterium]
MNKKRIIVTSLVILLPMLAGIFMWNMLPESIPVHWNFEGEIDDYASKAFAVFGLPLIMLGAHLICSLATLADPKTQNFNSKMLGIVLWICPVLSILCMTASYSASFGFDVRVEFIIPLFMGVLFLIIGNYLPKCKQNYTIGIKVPWTLNSEDNWNKTHRLAGIIWTAGSAIIIVGSFFKKAVIFTTFVPIVIMVFVPIIYSYLYYRKHGEK